MRALSQSDTEAACTFLQSAQPDGPWHLVTLPPEGGPPAARTFSGHDREDMSEWIEANQGEANVYWHVNRLRAGMTDRKAKKEDVEAAVFLHVDVDDVDALERILRFNLPPTAILFSGGGYQSFWKLDEPCRDLERVEAINIWLAKELGGDKCHNVDRIMRLPGTLNVPGAKKRAVGRTVALAYVVEEHTDWSRTFSLDAFGHVPPNTPAPAVGAFIRADATTETVHAVSMDDLPPAVDDRTRRVIANGDDPERPRNSAVPRFPSRSEAVFSVACALARAGCAAEVIASILINPIYGISASILERRDPRKYAVKQARAAEATVTNGWPEADKNGQPRATMRNAVVALRRLDLVFAFDLFRHRKVIGGRILQEHEGEISDDGVLAGC